MLKFELIFQNYPNDKITVGLPIIFDDKTMKNVKAGARFNLFNGILTIYGLNDPVGDLINHAVV